MRWKKKGLIFKPEGDKPWAITHAQVPLAQSISDDLIRIYYGTRDERNRTRTSFVDVDADNPKNILNVHHVPILELGRAGLFDDSGVMPSDVVNYKGKTYFYYVGWNTGKTARYRTAIGLAVSEDLGRTFCKISDGPVMDRNLFDPVSTSCQSILIEDGKWKTWYMSYLKWEENDGIMEPFYQIKYAESNDGIHWKRKNIICIALEKDEGGIAAPSVIKDEGLYRMWYSIRKCGNYRDDKTQSYRIGYAESRDGLHWQRKDDLAGIDVSESGWDSEMIAYPFIYRHRDRLYMFFNGNGFGKTGFGFAELE